MTIVFGQMVLSMMNELQPRGPQRAQLTRTDHLETAAAYHAISMRNALYFPIVEECSTGFGVLHEALHCLPDIPLLLEPLHLLEALQTPANITNTALTRLSGTRPETWRRCRYFRDRRRACPFC